MLGGYLNISGGYFDTLGGYFDMLGSYLDRLGGYLDMLGAWIGGYGLGLVFWVEVWCDSSRITDRRHCVVDREFCVYRPLLSFLWVAMALVWDPSDIKQEAWDAPEGAQELQMGSGSNKN